MNKELLIVFVKNIKLGSVKTRLAKTIGNEGALAVYEELLAITEKATSSINFDKIIYFSDAIIDSKWENSQKKAQLGNDLGERMKNAFLDGFQLGYKSIVLIGSDLPEISSTVITDGFKQLQKNEIVFGPAQDGGYYLIGMTKMYATIFENKPWSQPHLLQTTLAELEQSNRHYSLLKTLNDIDTYDDLMAADFYKNNTELQQKIKLHNDQYDPTNN